jgi:hypothetical protein
MCTELVHVTHSVKQCTAIRSKTRNTLHEAVHSTTEQNRTRIAVFNNNLVHTAAQATNLARQVTHVVAQK